MSATTTDAPSSAKRTALARPIPEPAPVTMATFPESNIARILGTSRPASRATPVGTVSVGADRSRYACGPQVGRSPARSES